MLEVICPSLGQNAFGNIPGDALCQQFQKQACQTWGLLRKARKYDRQLLEETLTDLHLLSFQSMRSPTFRIRSFSKRDERNTGADWEWWFGSKAGLWIGLRIQAKVIELSTDTYPHLHYRYQKPNGGVLFQTDQLIQSAANGKPRRIPLYCLYTHWDHQHLGRPHPSAGCLLLSPLVVKAHQSAREARLSRLIRDSMPWHCIVCCPQTGQKDFALRTAAMAKHVLAGSFRRMEVVDSPSDLRGLLEGVEPSTDVPDYVRRISDGSSPVLEDPNLGFVTVFTEVGLG